MYKSAKGFTLHELMIGMAILVLTTSLGLPTLYNFINDYRLTAAANDLLLAALFARSEAIKRNAPVFLVARSGSWSKGWEVYPDYNYSSTRDEAENVLLEGKEQPELTIRGNQPVAAYIRFSPSGRAKLPGGAFQAGTITLCHPESSSLQRELVLNSRGRLKLQKSSREGCSP
jgi:type IV fimbrial biogenesis protein FimT